MTQAKSFVANILVLGKTGAGKSSFINYFLDEDVESVATGKPVTKGYLREHLSREGDIRIFDNEGFEAKKAEDQMNAILNLVHDRNGSSVQVKDCFHTIFYADSLLRRPKRVQVKDWFHTIFYCINVANARFEDAEILFIQKLNKTISQHVHIILTHCDQVEPEQLRDMKDYIREKLNNDRDYRIFEVVSREWRKRNGTCIHRRGREAILDSIFQLLWEDISFRVSNDYASELLRRSKEYIEESFICAEKGLRKALNPRTLFAAGKESKLNQELVPIEKQYDEQIEQILEKTNRHFDQILGSASELFINYKGHFFNDARFAVHAGLTANDMIIEWYHDLVFNDSVIEGLLYKTLPTIRKFMEDNAEQEENIMKMIGNLGGAFRDYITSGFRIKQAVNEEKEKVLRALPSHQKIQEDVNNKLLAFGRSSLGTL